ncbi:hypothetical protein FJZ19_02915 [Candidatus Pacearchaeota archaeon]|nr:hypothetical protein [Candidatus Pacearchaeota archaeon]
MKQKIKSIIENSFYQLLVIYSIIILLVALGLFWKYSFQLHIFAIILAIFGISITNKESKGIKLNRKIHIILFIITVSLIFLFRAIPYFNNSIPLGYDAGIYKYGIEHGLHHLDNWILRGGMEPGFLYLITFLNYIFSSQFILTWLLILFCILLGIGIYFLVREFSNSTTAIIALFIYTFSIIQFKAFSMMYYKNIIALIFILFSVYFLRKYEKTNKLLHLSLFIILAGLIGAVHRPTFYIFGLSYFFYVFISPYKNKTYNFKRLRNNIFYGILIIIIAGLFYLGNFSQAITSMFEPVLQGFIQPGEAGGTFINFFTYQFSSLFYLPFALLGLFYFLRKKQVNILVLWAIINLIIVYFQFFFFNRFIIHLDLILVIFSAFGFSLIIEQKRKLGVLLLIILLLSGGILAYKEAINSKPLINSQELEAIKQLQNTPKNSFIMATDSYYSPWVLGYSERKTIAPGLFDYNQHNQAEWIKFWISQNLAEIQEFMNKYQKPLYIFIGEKQQDNLKQFDNLGCFEKIYLSGNNSIYKYAC